MTVPPPRTHALDITWRLDGAIVGSARGSTLTGAMLPAGSHQVSVTVRDTTATGAQRPDLAPRVEQGLDAHHVGDDRVSRQGHAALRGGQRRRGVRGADRRAEPASDAERHGPGELDGDLESAVAHGLAVRRHRPRRSHRLDLAGRGPASRGEPQRGDHVRVGRQRQSCRANRRWCCGRIPAASSAPPIGFVDTPLDNTSGVVGAIPFTGWAVDDVEVARVTICRDAVAGESAPLDPNCSGAAQIYVGDALFIDGARPDVQAAYPDLPRASEAGWGLMVLTNMLPGGGNGPYAFSMYAHRPRRPRDAHRHAPAQRVQRHCHAAVRHDRHARAGRDDRRLGLRQLRLGAHATARRPFRRTARRSTSTSTGRRSGTPPTTTIVSTSRRCSPATTTASARLASAS